MYYHGTNFVANTHEEVDLRRSTGEPREKEKEVVVMQKHTASSKSAGLPAMPDFTHQQTGIANICIYLYRKNVK